jgi:conjugal transfer ATP-binding protein TraC
MGRELIIFDRPAKKVPVDPALSKGPGLGELSVPPVKKTAKASARAQQSESEAAPPLPGKALPLKTPGKVLSSLLKKKAAAAPAPSPRPVREEVAVPDLDALTQPGKQPGWAKEAAAEAFEADDEREAIAAKKKRTLLSALFKEKKQTTSESADAEALYQKGLATIKDLIAPPAIRVSPTSIQVGDVVARTLFIIAYPRFLSTNWFSPIINIDFPMDTALFIHPIDTAEILKQLRKSATQVQSQMNIEVEEGKIRDPVLESALQNIEELRDRLQQGTEKFFRFGLYMMLYGADEKDLNKKVQSVEAILEAQLVYTKPAVLRQDQGFTATRPLGNDALDVANNLNTEPLSTTFPFVSSDLSSNEGILYGINRHNNSLILFDRFKMENANMVVFAKSGAGKSYTVKLEVLRSLMFDSNVIIIDPENEYKHLCETVGGAFLKISLNSDIHLNPFDLPRKTGDDDGEGIFRNSIANLIGLLHLMLGNLSAEEDAILDQAIRETYAIRDIHENSNFGALTATSFPTMSDLYAVLKNMEGAESIAARLQRYTEGIFSGFLNNQTNIDTENQLIVFNIRDLEEELRPVAMYIILQYIWNDIRSKLRQRIIVVDEAWIMMQNEDAASFLFGIAKRCRKYFTGLTTITQDISDFMSSRYGKPIITNSSMQLLLRQSPASIDYITETFYLTDHEKFLLLESNVGEGIFFAGTKHAAIKVIASYSEDQIITSDPRQLLEIEEAKKEFDANHP